MIAEKAADGKDVEKAKKDEEAKLQQKEATNQAKLADPNNSDAAMQAGNKMLKAKQDELERQNVARMNKSMPPGMGLRKEFNKIEAEKVKAQQKGAAEKKAAAAKKEEEQMEADGVAALTSQGQALLSKGNQQKAKDQENALKPKGAEAKLEAEEKKVEETTTPGKEADKAMFGKSEQELMKGDKVDQAKLDKANKDAQKTAQKEKDGGDVEELNE